MNGFVHGDELDELERAIATASNSALELGAVADPAPVTFVEDGQSELTAVFDWGETREAAAAACCDCFFNC